MTNIDTPITTWSLHTPNGTAVQFTDAEWESFVELAGDAGVDVLAIALEGSITASDATTLAAYLRVADLVVRTHGAVRRIATDGADTDTHLATAARIADTAGLDALAGAAQHALLTQAATVRIEPLTVFERASVDAWIAALSHGDTCTIQCR